MATRQGDRIWHPNPDAPPDWNPPVTGSIPPFSSPGDGSQPPTAADPTPAGSPSDSELRRRLSPEQADRLHAQLLGVDDSVDDSADNGPSVVSETPVAGERSVAGDAATKRADADRGISRTLTPLDAIRVPGVTIVRPLKRGGMGVVYEATQTEPVRRRVALKLIAPERLGPDFEARFRREQAMLAGLEHPCIARLYDAGITADGQPYFIMEFVDGQPMAEFCRENRISLRERIRLIAETCEAVQHLHARQIVHRDLKPDNVLVTRVGGRPVPRVIDFGLAKLVADGEGDPLGGGRTQHGTPVGTVRYMSPEQTGRLDPASGAGHVDAASDIYSLGAMLYQLVCGDTPVSRDSADDQAEILRKIAEEDPPPVSQRMTLAPSEHFAAMGVSRRHAVGEARRDLDAIVSKAMNRQRTGRYASADAMAADLRAYLEHRPVAARASTRGYVASRFVRRNPAAAVALAALLLGGVGTTLGFFQARAAESRAVDARDRAVTARQEADAARAEAEDTAARERDALREARASLAAAEGRREAVLAARDVMWTLAVKLGADTPEAAALREGLRPGIEAAADAVSIAPPADGSAAELMRIVTGVAELVGAAEEAQLRAAKWTEIASGEGVEVVGYDLITALRDVRSGRLESAEAHAAAAAAAIESDLGPTHIMAGWATYVAANIRFGSGDTEGAARQFEAIIDGLRLDRPDHRILYFAALHNLAAAKLQAGRPEEAVPLFRRVVAEWTLSKTPTDGELLSAKSHLAIALRRSGEDEEYVATQQEVLRGYESRKRPNLTDVSVARLNLASALANTGRDERALMELDRLLKDLGDQSVGDVRLRARYDRATVLEKLGRPLPAGELATLRAEIARELPETHELRRRAKSDAALKAAAS